MVRKLALVLTGWWVVVAAPVWALGLGDIRLASSLNQNFDAAIALRDLGDLRADEVIVSLGSTEDFTRAGLERSFFLLDFHYQVELKGQGAGVVHVSSNRPVTEPVVEFLINVVWPSGRLQRQYAVLLDPPRSASSASSAVAPASVGTGDSTNDGSSSEQTPPAADSRPASHPRVARTAHKERFSGGSYGPTRRDDTLWRIAQRVRPSSEVTVQQTMLALQRVNPDAFIGANINRLKARVTLQVPDAQQIQQTGSSDAVAEVARQTEAWRSGARGAPAETGAPVESTQEPTPAALPAPRDQLRIVTGAKGKSGTPATGSAKPASPAPAAKAELESQLAGSKEEQDRLNLELSEANTKLTGTAQQTTQLQQQIVLKDKQLADANRALAELRAKVQQIKPTAATAGVPAAAPAATGLLDTLAGKALFGGAAALLAGLVAALFMYNRAKAQADATARAKAAVDERLERTMRMEKERTGNTMRGGIPLPAAAVAVATVLPEPARAVPAPRLVAEPLVAAPVAPSLSPVPALSPTLSDTQETRDFDKTVLLENAGDLARTAARDDLVTASDVVSEADIYIAYGRFPQAISFLQSALEKEPERNDARLKLMEAYVETRDAGAFTLEAQTLLDRHPNEAELRRARQLQARLVGVSVIPAEKLGEQSVDFDKTIIDTSLADRATNATVADATSPISLDLDLDRTDLLNETQSVRPLDVDLTLDQPAANDAGSLDFNLTLDGLDDDEKGGQLGGDLGMSFRDDRRGGDFDRTADSTPKPTTEDDFGLDLTIDGRGAPVEPARRAVRPQVPDSDDGLSLTLDGKDESFSRPSRYIPDDVVSSDTVETTPIEEDLDFLSEAPDEARTKLDLARAYIDMGDGDAARDVLHEVLAEGSDAHQHEARELLSKLA